MTYKMKINTVGELIDFLKDIPRETEIEISECGQTGYVDKPLEIEKVFYGHGIEPLCYINVKAEGYHY